MENSIEREQVEQLVAEQNYLLRLVAIEQPLERSLTELTSAISRLQKCARACIFLVANTRDRFERGFSAEVSASFVSAVADTQIGELAVGVADVAVYRGEAVACANVANDAGWPRSWRELCISHGILSCYAVPVWVEDQPVAALMLCFAQAHKPKEWEARIASFGADVASIVIARDRSVRALKTSEERFRGTFENAAVGVAHVALDGRFMEVNASLCRLSGYSQDALRIRDYFDITHADDVDHDQRQQLALLQGELESFSLEKRFVRPDGKVVWVNSTVTLVRNSDGSPAYFICITEDIDSRKHIEAQLADLATEREELLESERTARVDVENANRLKDEFLATLSHELRTPLANVVSWSRLLQRKYDGGDEQIRRGLSIIIDNAMIQARMIADLLDMSRIASGKIRLELRTVDLRQIVEDAAASHRPAADAKGIQLTVESAAEPVQVNADPTRMQQVLSNLLSNAIKFTPEGGRVSIETEGSGNVASFVVRDSGTGIAPQFLAHIFDRFTQADSGRNRQFGGLGLGLAIVKQLIELHGGDVQAQSDGEGQGATFVVRLPLQRQAGLGLDAQEITEGPILSGLNVLAVEDDAHMLELTRRVLSEYGANVTAVASATDALKVLEAEDPDVLLSDLGLPGMDGYTLLRTVRSKGGAKKLPAIAITAFSRDEDRMRAMSAGFQGYLVKPYETAELVMMTRRLGRTHQAVSQAVGRAAAADFGATRH